MTDLVPCPGCSRHVRRSERACPFCKADVRETMARAPERAMPTVRLGRGALFAFAAATVSAVACGGSTDTGNGGGTIDKRDGAADDGSSGGASGTGGAGDGGQPMALYGAPAMGGMQGSGGFAALYGAPAAGGTGGTTGAGGEMAVPAYGAPFPTGGTSGTGTGGQNQGSGGFAALYGAVPAPNKP